MDNWEEACQSIASEIVRLLIKKQRDYGHDNINAFGEYGILVRANDKIARLKNLYDKETIENESIEDSWLDEGGYSILALMVRRGLFNLELKE